MDLVTLITIFGGFIGIVAGTVQVLDYVEKKRREQPALIELVQKKHDLNNLHLHLHSHKSHQ
ncbi:MAG: hypothetical protein HC773_08280 [Scytonema sp. CRU_2_7]|nr:hypothetical protein [Scytonema sp. CRU_2_7]